MAYLNTESIIDNTFKSEPLWRQHDQAVRAMDLQFGGSEIKSRPDRYTVAGFVHGSPEFKSSATLVNSQLVCLQPVGILNPVILYLNYLFQAFARRH